MDLELIPSGTSVSREEFNTLFNQSDKATQDNIMQLLEDHLDSKRRIDKARLYLQNHITDEEATFVINDLNLVKTERFPQDKVFTGKELRQIFNRQPGTSRAAILEEIGNMRGYGSTIRGKGLYDHEIEEIMKPYKRHGFLGVVPIDRVSDLDPGNKKRISFVMNTDPSEKPGKHWVAIYIDGLRDMTVEYYDSYARAPSKQLLKEIKQLIDKMNINSYLKFKENKVVDQALNSDTCGFHASGFLIDRYDGIKFPECTKFNNIEKGERKAYKLKHRFGYI